MRRLYMLLSLAVVSVSLVFVTIDQQTKEVLSKQNAKLFPSLLDQLDGITSISIESVQEEAFTAQRINGKWFTSHLSENYYFPANQKIIENLLNALATARIYAVKTSRAEKHALLGVATLDDASANSHLLRLKAETNEWTVLVGNTSQHRDASFVRLPDEPQAYLLDRAVRLPQSQNAWLISSVLQLSTEDIQSIEVKQQRTHSFTAQQAKQWSSDFLTALVQTEYVDALERNSVLLNWFTRDPLRVIAIETQHNHYRLSLYKNDQAQEVWMVVSSEQDSWQQDWAFQLAPTTAEHLLTPTS